MQDDHVRQEDEETADSVTREELPEGDLEQLEQAARQLWPRDPPTRPAAALVRTGAPPWCGNPGDYPHG